MKKRSNGFKILILTIILMLFSTLIICIGGRVYTLRVAVGEEYNDINSFDIYIENSNKVVKCVDKRLEDGELILSLKSISRGKSFVEIKAEGKYYYHSVFVHSFGVITIDNYFGASNFGAVIPISVLIILFYSFFLLVNSFRRNMKDNMYQYRNIFYLGFIIFIGFSIVNLIFAFNGYRGFYYFVEKTVHLYGIFSMILLPIAFVVFLFVIINNIILLKREGKTWRNMLGVILGFFLLFMTVFPSILSDYLQSATWVDVHYERSIALYIEMLIDTSIYSFVSYLECILVATIILSIRVSRYTPKYDKDYIIILGCMIKKDGTLTNLLKSRVDKALEFRNKQVSSTGKDLIFVPSGGKGSNEVISESLAMKNYLLSVGVKDECIILEDKSVNTYENIKFSYQLIKDKNKCANIAFSTTNYHVFRAGNIALKQNIYIEGVGASTKVYFWLNAFIREFIATLYSEKKKHIMIFLFIIILSVVMILFIYIANML